MSEERQAIRNDASAGARLPAKIAAFILPLRAGVGAGAFVVAIASIFLFATKSLSPACAAAILVLFTLGPPLWFLAEHGTESDALRADLKATQEYASQLWAAVVASLLYFFPGGPIAKLVEALDRISAISPTSR